MKNMFAYPSMDGQHDGITIFFFLWRCKYSVPSVRHPATGAASGFTVQGEAAG